jgi:hypothetical protein
MQELPVEMFPEREASIIRPCIQCHYGIEESTGLEAP